MARRVLWERPRLRVGEATERRVSWLELFYDLVFVVIVAQLAHHLAEHVTWDGVRTYMLLFVPAWWAWIGGTFYNERFETYDLSYRLFVFLQMLGVAAMAVFAHDGTGKLAEEFALAYVAVRLIIVVLWARGGWHNPEFRPVSNRYTLGFLVSIVLFTLSIFVAPPLRFVMWAIGLLFDLVTPITTLGYLSRLPRSHHSKLPERFGLFMIIVLGEAMVGVISGLADLEMFTLGTAITGALGMALVFGLWWIYFDFIGRREGPYVGIGWQLTWNYTHLPLAMSIAAVGAAVLNFIAHEGETLEPGVRWLMAGAMGIALMAIAIIETVSRREAHEPTHALFSPGLKVIGAVLAFAIGAVGGGVTSSTLMLGLCLPIGIQMIYGAYVWYTQALPEDPA